MLESCRTAAPFVAGGSACPAGVQQLRTHCMHTAYKTELLGRFYCQVLSPGGACEDFCNLGWAVVACQLLLAVWLVLAL